MNRCTGCLLALALLLVGCPTGVPDDDGQGDAEECFDETEQLPTDTAITGLTRSADGTLWAMGNDFRWWADSGAGWAPVDSLRGTGGSGIAAEGSTLWAVGQWGVFHSEGVVWTDESAALTDDGTPQDVAGLGDGRVAVVSSEEANGGNGVRVRLHVWDAGEFTTTDLGWITDYGRAVSGDGAGAALVAGESVVWLLEGDEWSELTLPVADYWVDVLGFDGYWILVSTYGTVLRGSADGWDIEEVEVYEPRLAGTATDDLWIAGMNADTHEGGVIWRDQGAGWAEVPAPEQTLRTAVSSDAGELVVGGDGPTIGRGDGAGVDVEWTNPSLVGDGAIWSASDGKVFFVDHQGQLLVDEEGVWTTLGWVGNGGYDVDMDGCQALVFALSGEGEVVTWDGNTLESEALQPDESTFYSALSVTSECVPVVGGVETSEDEDFTPVVRYRDGNSWTDLPIPPDRSVHEVLATSPTDLVIATGQGLYRGDGATWTSVTGTTDDISDLAQTADGRVWVSTQNAGLNELVGDALVPVSGSPTRVDLLLPLGNALLAKEWSNDIATIHRWDGTWETVTTSDEVGALLALEGDDYLLVITWDSLSRVCLGDGAS